MYTTSHKTVLEREVVDLLITSPGGIYIDATFGGGGHTRAILQKDPSAFVIGIDIDKQSLDQFGEILRQEFPDRFIPIWGNFAHLYKLIKKDWGNIQGILADFGTSQIQIHEKDGFSFRHDTPLDMRMSSSHFSETAADVVNSYREHELTKIFWENSQERFSRKIAQAIVMKRKIKKIKTTGQLVDIILTVVAYNNHTRIHPATKVFQALRIHVNKELESIHSFLISGFEALKEKGRFACISFHSLEDEKVKAFFREKVHSGHANFVCKKALVAQEDELINNISARSAKLRVLEKINPCM